MKPFLIGLAGWLSTVVLACGQLPLTERITAKFGERVAELQLRLGEEAFPGERRPEVEQRIVTATMMLEFDSDRLWRVTFKPSHKLSKPLVAFAETWRNFEPIGDLKVDRMTMRGEFQRYLDAWRERAARAGKREGVDYWIETSKGSTTDQVTVELEPRRRVFGDGTLTSDSWRFEFTTELNLRYNPETAVGALYGVTVTADTFSTRQRAKGGGVVSSAELAKPRGPGVTLEDGTHLTFGYRLDDAMEEIGAWVSDAPWRGARRGIDRQIYLRPCAFYFDTGRLSRIVYNRFDGPITPFPEEWKNFPPIGEQRFKPGMQPGEFALYLNAWEEREKAAGHERGKDFSIREISEPGGVKTTEISFPPQAGAAWGDVWRIMFREAGTPPDRRMELFGIDAIRGEFNTRPRPGLDRRAKAIQDSITRENLPGVEVPKVEIAPIGGGKP